MNTTILLSSLLIVHLAALVVMAGTTLIDYFGYQTFWKLYDREREKSSGVLLFLNKFSRLIGIGAALLVLSGIGMMALTHGVFGEQLWFRIKFGFVLVLIANGILVGRRQGLKLRKAIDLNEAGLPQLMDRIRGNLKRFHIAQLFIFFIIILLSIFKFN
ncbi:hypothetical protein ACFFGT_08720 [Mucilaginibacter angelicae]|uniref:DUF2214 domain-containing protein n=1 Tax=Mucilaginibacter angelicae TaxID=869718 RepID=A0ABV6L481_9SPHI